MILKQKRRDSRDAQELNSDATVAMHKKPNSDATVATRKKPNSDANPAHLVAG